MSIAIVRVPEICRTAQGNIEHDYIYIPVQWLQVIILVTPNNIVKKTKAAN